MKTLSSNPKAKSYLDAFQSSYRKVIKALNNPETISYLDAFQSSYGKAGIAKFMFVHLGMPSDVTTQLLNFIKLFGTHNKTRKKLAQMLKDMQINPPNATF